MKSIKCVVLLCAASLISACDRPAAKQVPGEATVQENAPMPKVGTYYVDMAALPLIQNTIRLMAAQPKGDVDIAAIQKICLLARGEVTKVVVKESLKRDGIKLESIPQSGSNMSLLINDDNKGRQTLCAAYIANNLNSPLDRTQFMEKKAETISDNNKKKITVYKEQVNPTRLSDTLATNMAVARANAEVYALIASLLRDEPGLSPEQYSVKAKKIFSELSPYYLLRVRQLYSPDANGYLLTAINKEGDYAFSSSGGYSFTRTDNTILLSYQGVNWLGRGKLLGSDYVLKAKIFPEEATKSLEK